MNTPMQPGVILNSHYKIVRQLGQSNVGTTYLAEDTHRFNEICVIKELTPQVKTPQERKKIEELFEREAKVLYKLQHPQIPHFRELFRFQDSLFLVQDYIQGQTYRDLLKIRQLQGQNFTEAEIIQLLTSILPVLAYIHARGIIHRDISPDNLILRPSDQLPVLIDFGSVKQVTPETFSQSQQPITTALATQLGQMQYAPPEQIQGGIVFPHSDLYALAATVLVLLTGKEPQQLGELWAQNTPLSPQMSGIITKMLAKQPCDRFQTAQEVLESLNQTPVITTVPNQPTIVVSPASVLTSNPDNTSTDSPMTSTSTPTSNPVMGCLTKLLLILSLSIGSGIVGWLAGKAWINQLTQKVTTSSDILTNSPSQDNKNAQISSAISDTEWKRKNDIQSRRLNLGINSQFFYQLVDQVFKSRYPEKQDKLTNTSADTPWREKWDNIALELLDKLNSLSPETRKNLGQYNQTQLDSWKQQVNQLHLSSRSLYDLGDAAFLSLFPEQENQNFIDQPIGQVWYGFIYEKLQALQKGDIYEKISAPDEGLDTQLKGQLEPGAGRAYVIKLNSSQTLKVELQTDQNTWISIYSPTGKNNLLEDSSGRQWTGTLPESGHYEFVIVSKSKTPLNYQLNLKVTQ